MDEAQEQFPRRLRIFLCHSSADKPAVRGLYRRLCSDDFDPWFDEESLEPGQDWKQEIEKAVRAADIVLVCLSRISVGRDGFANKEIVFALDVADEKPEGVVYIIPVKLEECEVPDRLRRWNWVELFKDQGYEKLFRALKKKAINLGITIPSTVVEQVEAAGLRAGVSTRHARLRTLLRQLQSLVEQLEAAGREITLGPVQGQDALFRQEMPDLREGLEAKGIKAGSARLFELHTGTGNVKSILITTDGSSLNADWGPYVRGSGKLPNKRNTYYLIFDRDRMRQVAKNATSDRVWFAPAYPTRTPDGKTTTRIDWPTGSVDIAGLGTQLPLRNLNIPDRIVLAAEGDPKPIQTALGSMAGRLSWNAPKASLAELLEHRSPSFFLTKNIDRARKHMDTLENQEALTANKIAFLQIGISGQQDSNLDELWFTPTRGDHSLALLIVGNNTEEFRRKLKKAAEAGLLKNKQVVLATSFDPKETDSLREMLLGVGEALTVWTPENRISPEAARKLQDYLQKVEADSTQNPPKDLDNYIGRAMELWYRESPDDADLPLILNSSRWT